MLHSSLAGGQRTRCGLLAIASGHGLSLEFSADGRPTRAAGLYAGSASTTLVSPTLVDLVPVYDRWSAQMICPKK